MLTLCKLTWNLKKESFQGDSDLNRQGPFSGSMFVVWPSANADHAPPCKANHVTSANRPAMLLPQVGRLRNSRRGGQGQASTTASWKQENLVKASHHPHFSRLSLSLDSPGPVIPTLGLPKHILNQSAGAAGLAVGAGEPVRCQGL